MPDEAAPCSKAPAWQSSCVELIAKAQSSCKLPKKYAVRGNRLRRPANHAAATAATPASARSSRLWQRLPRTQGEVLRCHVWALWGAELK